MAAAAPAHASQVTLPDRESSYPAGVDNVTHAPWQPRAGEDVVVTLRLGPEARLPGAVSLLYCRVEPEYVCGLPLFMDASENGRTWRGTIVSDIEDANGFLSEDTRHVGYNVTMRFPGDNGTIERVSAPMGNYWVPETYPEDSDGVYYFLRYEGQVTSALPGPLVPLVVAAVAAVAVALRRVRRGA